MLFFWLFSNLQEVVEELCHLFCLHQCLMYYKNYMITKNMFIEDTLQITL